MALIAGAVVLLQEFFSKRVNLFSGVVTPCWSIWQLSLIAHKMTRLAILALSPNHL
ncbi:hypothetical protein [Streptococcus infantis]|uniref:hypothetical protein n=1 Tax=Streptococcus infantis TaxID=68892 RepID=UPI001F48F759|nr:hypothetical protein [Streptococcus infantis]